MHTINNTQDVIDSRDILERIEELEGSLQERHEQGGFMSDFNDWLSNSRDDSRPIHAAFGDEGPEVQEEIEELYALHRLAEQCEGYSDWEYGETLINADYFTAYIEELIKDCYEMPKEMNSGSWPYRHMTIDYEAAAEEAKQDYAEVDFAGNTFFIRA